MVWPIHLVPRPPTNHTIVHVSWLSFLSICSILPFFWWYTKSFDNLKLGDGDYSSSSFALVSLFFHGKHVGVTLGMTPVTENASVSRVLSTPD